MPIIVGIFDIGYTNFAFVIEKYSITALKYLIRQYSNLDKKDRLIEQRQHSDLLKKMLDEFYKQGKTLFHDLTDLNQGEKCGLQNSTRKNLAEYLNSKKDLLDNCNYIIIEQQFKTGGACNFDAILLGESTYSWLIFNIKAEIMYTPSRYKTCVLGCPRSIIETKNNGLRITRDITKQDRKKWSVVMANHILNLRGQKLEYKKCDDVSDCILMGMAWILKTYVI